MIMLWLIGLGVALLFTERMTYAMERIYLEALP